MQRITTKPTGGIVAPKIEKTPVIKPRIITRTGGINPPINIIEKPVIKPPVITGGIVAPKIEKQPEKPVNELQNVLERIKKVIKVKDLFKRNISG